MAVKGSGGGAPSIAVFKKKLLSIIRPPAKSVYEINDPKGLSHLTQLWVGFSKLNFHKFKPILPVYSGCKVRGLCHCSTTLTSSQS